MDAKQIVNKIEQGKFTKQELSDITHAAVTATFERNYYVDV